MSAGKMLHTGYFVCTHTLKNYREHCMCVSSARARGVCEIMNMHLLMCVNSVIYQTLPGHSPATDELQLELQDEPRMRAENADGNLVVGQNGAAEWYASAELHKRPQSECRQSECRQRRLNRY